MEIMKTRATFRREFPEIPEGKVGKISFSGKRLGILIGKEGKEGKEGQGDEGNLLEILIGGEVKNRLKPKKIPLKCRDIAVGSLHSVALSGLFPLLSPFLLHFSFTFQLFSFKIPGNSGAGAKMPS